MESCYPGRVRSCLANLESQLLLTSPARLADCSGAFIFEGVAHGTGRWHLDACCSGMRRTLGFLETFPTVSSVSTQLRNFTTGACMQAAPLLFGTTMDGTERMDEQIGRGIRVFSPLSACHPPHKHHHLVRRRLVARAERLARPSPRAPRNLLAEPPVNRERVARAERLARPSLRAPRDLLAVPKAKRRHAFKHLLLARLCPILLEARRHRPV